MPSRILIVEDEIVLAKTCARLLEAGASAVLPKPFPARALTDAISAVAPLPTRPDQATE